jgi:hypothetical protein
LTSRSAPRPTLTPSTSCWQTPPPGRRGHPIGSYAEEPGTGHRLFTTGRITSRERVVEADPGRRFSYELVSGLAVREYRADIDLEPADGGTSIHWHSSFVPKVPGTGWLYRRTLQRFVGECAQGLADHAARPIKP